MYQHEAIHETSVSYVVTEHNTVYYIEMQLPNYIVKHIYECLHDYSIVLVMFACITHMCTECVAIKLWMIYLSVRQT